MFKSSALSMMSDWHNKSLYCQKTKGWALKSSESILYVFLLENGESFSVLTWGFFKSILIETIGFSAKKH